MPNIIKKIKDFLKIEDLLSDTRNQHIDALKGVTIVFL
jgi:hypothetical protein